MHALHDVCTFNRVTGPLIEEEGYWERCCRARWSLCVVDDYDNCWKRMFFERHVEEMIENFVPLQSNEKRVCLTET